MLKLLDKVYFRSIAFYFVYSLQERGLWPSLKLWAGEIIYCIKEKDRFLFSRPFIDHPPSEGNQDNNHFQATYYSIAREALEAASEQGGSGSLCDVGAGNGRIIKVALGLGYKDIYAIEIDARWRRSLHKLQERVSDRFNFVIGDALEVMPRRLFDTMVMFNPMGRDKFEKFIRLLERTERLPRNLVLVNPKYDDLVLEVGYEETKHRCTGRHVEYKIFRRLKH